MSAAEEGPSRSDCLQKAMDLLARRPHFRRELQAKLQTRKYQPEDVERALGRLEAQGLLDDAECARQLVEGAWRRKGFGPRRMRAELIKRGVDDGVVELVLTEAWSLGEEDVAREVARVWLGRRPGAEGDGQARRSALARHLERKGFGGAAIHQVLSGADVMSES